jgi:hypothetical protein
MYKEFSPGGQLHAQRWMLTNFTMNDFLLAIMVLCLVVPNEARGIQPLTPPRRVKCSGCSSSRMISAWKSLGLVEMRSEFSMRSVEF